jgi:hypothetical protein
LREFSVTSPPTIVRLHRLRRETLPLLVLMGTVGGLVLAAIPMVLWAVWPDPLSLRAMLGVIGLGLCLMIAVPTLWVVSSIRKPEASRVELGPDGALVPKFGSWDLPKREERLVPWRDMERVVIVETAEEMALVPGLMEREWMPSPDPLLSGVFDRTRKVRRRDVPLMAIRASRDRLFIFSRVFLDG